MNAIYSTIVQKWNKFLVWIGLRKPLSFRDKLPSGAKEQYDQIVKLLNPNSRRTNANEVASYSSKELIPSRTHLWTIELPGIDPFLVAEFSPPSVMRIAEENGRITYSSLHVSFHDPMNDSTLAKLINLMHDEHSLVVKIIDHIGVITEIWRMKIRPIGIHPLTILDHRKSEPIKWQLECECSSWEIQMIDHDENSSVIN